VRRNCVLELLLVDQRLQWNLALGGGNLVIGWRQNFQLFASAAPLAAVDNATDQKHEDNYGADDDGGFNRCGLALKPGGKPCKDTRKSDSAVTTNGIFFGKTLS